MAAPEDETLETEAAMAPPRGPGRPSGVAVAPSSPGVAYIVVMATPGASALLGRRFEIGTHASVGSAEDDDVSISVEGTVPHHARVERRKSGLWLLPAAGAVTVRKSGSGAGVMVREAIALAHGDQLILGRSVLQVIDGAAEEHYHECIYHLAIRDGMTGVLNARCFRDVLEREIGRARGGAVDPALVLFDVDDFARVNASYGMEAGDAVLRVVASRLSAVASGEETLGRCGGDELGLVVFAESIERAKERAGDLCRAVGEQPIVFDKGWVEVTVSAGVARGETSAEAMMARARERVRIAKREGKNRVVT